MAEPGERPSKRHRYKLEIISRAEWCAPERVWTSFAEGKTFSSFRQAELYGHEHRPHGHKMRIRKAKIERPTTQLDAESTQTQMRSQACAQMRSPHHTRWMEPGSVTSMSGFGRQCQWQRRVMNQRAWNADEWRSGPWNPSLRKPHHCAGLIIAGPRWAFLKEKHSLGRSWGDDPRLFLGLSLRIPCCLKTEKHRSVTELPD